MSEARPHKLRPWVLAVALVALAGGPVVLYHLLPAAGVSAAVASGVVLVVVVKHLGLLAALALPYSLRWRRRRRGRANRPTRS